MSFSFVHFEMIKNLRSAIILFFLFYMTFCSCNYLYGKRSYIVTPIRRFQMRLETNTKSKKTFISFFSWKKKQIEPIPRDFLYSELTMSWRSFGDVSHISSLLKKWLDKSVNTVGNCYLRSLKKRKFWNITLFLIAFLLSKFYFVF